MAKLKQKQCAANGCTEMFTPRNMQHRTHHYQCAIQYQKELTEKRKAKDKRKAVKEFNENDKKYLAKIARTVCHKYILKRDKGNPCISCGETANRYEAGHYMSSGGNGHIRYDERNIHAQCHRCNCHMSANLIPYRKNLIEKIGVEEVERLEVKVVKQWTVEELKEIIDTYKSKTRDLDE